ncbi:DUF4976 domain-containing protein [Aquiflexum sp. TKW24L]|nr:DUF4976 domain-containing protein [Aquiflexum sp. TKW24L]
MDIIPPSEGLRTEDWKYFRYINDPRHEELYDLTSDPLEKNNLALNPAFQERLSEMRRKFENKESQIKAWK